MLFIIEFDDVNFFINIYIEEVSIVSFFIFIIILTFIFALFFKFTSFSRRHSTINTSKSIEHECIRTLIFNNFDVIFDF